MAKKTNKTSHVMDLLTNGASPEVEAPANGSGAAPSPAGGPAQEKAGEAQAHPAASKVTVVDEGSLNDRLSQEILSNLSKELKDDTQGRSGQAAAGNAASAGDMSADAAGRAAGNASGQAVAEDAAAGNMATGAVTGNTATGAVAGNAAAGATAGNMAAGVGGATGTGAGGAGADAAGNGQAADAAGEPARMDGMSPPVIPVGQTHHAIIPKSQISSNLQTGEYRFVNVMEQLMLRQDVASFQEQYNVCKCKKCTADVCALALTGLPSKYVVTRKDSLSPILSYYESKYKIFMLTELIKACNKVRESPRHKL